MYVRTCSVPLNRYVNVTYETIAHVRNQSTLNHLQTKLTKSGNMYAYLRSDIAICIRVNNIELIDCESCVTTSPERSQVC